MSQIFRLNLKIIHLSLVCVGLSNFIGWLHFVVLKIVSHLRFLLILNCCLSLEVIIRILSWWFFLFLLCNNDLIFQVWIVVIPMKINLASFILENWFLSWMGLLSLLVWLNLGLRPFGFRVFLLSECLDLFLLFLMNALQKGFQGWWNLLELWQLQWFKGNLPRVIINDGLNWSFFKLFELLFNFG